MTTREEIKERVAVMQAWLDGETIQYKSKSCVIAWSTFETECCPKFNFDLNEYRVKPHEPDSIDWRHVAPHLKFMARDKDQYVGLYADMPHISGAEFVVHSAHKVVRADCFSSLRIGTADWKDSLVSRPEGV